MDDKTTPEAEHLKSDAGDESWLHKWVGRTLLLIMAVEWVLLLLDSRWLSMFLVSLIIAVLLTPTLFRKKTRR